MAQPSDRPFHEEPPVQRLVRLLEEHGLEDALRHILSAIETRRAQEQDEARLELLEYMLAGQPRITDEEIEQARRECEE